MSQLHTWFGACETSSFGFRDQKTSDSAQSLNELSLDRADDKNLQSLTAETSLEELALQSSDPVLN